MNAGPRPMTVDDNGADADDNDLPGYAALLAAFHRAFGRELRQLVNGLPLPPDGRVLDLPCGDGFYTACLARRLFPSGSVVAADRSPAFLRAAARTLGRCRKSAPVEFVHADAYHPPFEDES